MDRKSQNHLRRKKVCIILLLAMMCSQMFFITKSTAQNRGVNVKPTGVQNSEKRIALVIGNGNYQKAKPLANPVNDAGDMAATLKTLGFDVLSGVDLNKQQMEKLIREFGNKLLGGGTGVFYYAGHGIQVGGENYLVPVEADIPEEDEVSYQAVPVSLVLTKMNSAQNELNIVILDACRNNPFGRSWRGFRDSSTNDGLAKISPPTGTLVLYSTEPGKVASDGAGRNGLFTEALLKQIKKPNLEYDQMVKQLSAEVWQKSNRQQLPWKEGNSLTDFYFGGDKPSAGNTASKPEKIESAGNDTVTEKDRATVEREAWDLIKNSADAQDYRSFLTDFPNGANAGKAKIKLEETVWKAVKDSSDKARLQAYLNEFPQGANAPLAKIKIRQLDMAVVTASNEPMEKLTESNSNVTSSEMKAGAIIGNSLGMKFAYSPAGTFQMGSRNGRNDEIVHTVIISQGFYMGRTEVTQAQWITLMGNNPSMFSDCGGSCPVEQVSWDDVQEFIRKLNSRGEGIYRLPTEAEWEYAARAGGTTGDTYGNLDDIAWYIENSGNQTHSVGQKQPNAWGLYDILGNVWEWTADRYGNYPSENVTDPKGSTTGSDRLIRGGGWTVTPVNLRSAIRYAYATSYRDHNVGFRLLRQR